MTVRFAGGMMQAVGGKVAQVGHGVQGGLSKRRKTAVASNIQRNRNYGFTKGTNKFSRGLRNATGALFAGPRGWMPTAGGAGVRSRNEAVGKAEWVKGNAAWQAKGQSDKEAIGWAVDSGSDTDAYKLADKKYNDALLAAGTDQDKIDLAKKQYTADREAIGRARSYGLYEQYGQEIAFEQAGMMGGLEHTPEQIRAAAERVAGGKDNFKYRDMLGNFERNTRDKQVYIYGGISTTPSEDKIVAGREDADRMLKNWYSQDLTTQLSVKPEILAPVIKFFQSELSLTDKEDPDDTNRAARQAHALVVLKEMEDGARAGVGNNNLTIDTMFNEPGFDRARSTARTDVETMINSNPAENVVKVFGPRARPATMTVPGPTVVQTGPTVPGPTVVQPGQTVTINPTVVQTGPTVPGPTVVQPGPTAIPTFQRSRSPAPPMPTTPITPTTQSEPLKVDVDELINRVARPPTKPNPPPRP